MPARHTILHFLSVFLLSAATAASAASTTPSFTITAKNASVGDEAEGKVNFTITSTNSFVGRVGMVCYGPSSNLNPSLVLADCTYETQYYDLTAGSSATGTITLYPPWETMPAVQPAPGGTPQVAALPLLGLLVSAPLVGFVTRRRRWLPLAALLLGCTAALTGCIGNGGLRMTHGDWPYTLTGTQYPQGISVTADFTVSVH